jgi:hypothetical protein
MDILTECLVSCLSSLVCYSTQESLFSAETTTKLGAISSVYLYPQRRERNMPNLPEGGERMAGLC